MEYVNQVLAWIESSAALMNGLSIAGTLASLLALYVLISLVRRNHPFHVQTLWYVFFLTLCIALPYYVYYVSSGQLMHDVMTPAANRTLMQEARSFVYEALTNPKGDVYFALGLLYIAIVPQIFSFVISGVFGCGSRPILVLEITKFAILGLVKSFCCLSAILAAQVILALAFAGDFFGDNSLYGQTVAPILFQATIYISFAFATSYAYLELDRIKAFVPGLARLVLPITEFLTRYSKDTKETPSPSTLERMLRPVIGHILGDIQIQEVALFILERRLALKGD